MSTIALEAIRRELDADERRRVTLLHRAADQLEGIADHSCDVVIINSVAQYFPSVDYLLSVLEWAAKVVTGGRIFIGDVRDLALLSVFHADIVHYRSQDGISGDELRTRAARSRPRRSASPFPTRRTWYPREGGS